MEPTYGYVKGQGWVIEPDCPYLDVEIQGKPYRLLDRNPKKGERYRYSGANNWNYVVNNKVDLNAWARNQCSAIAAWNRVYKGELLDSYNRYVTLVPL